MYCGFFVLMQTDLLLIFFAMEMVNLFTGPVCNKILSANT